MTRQSALLLSLSLSLLVSCTTNGSTSTPGSGPIPSASTPANGNPGTTPGSSPTAIPGGPAGASGNTSPTPDPGGAAGNGSSGSGSVQRLEIRLPTRFLSFRGETVRLEVQAFDAAGRPVDPGPLSFTSSRPELISVDASGLVRALVSDGFAEIRVSAGGQSAVQLISVVSADIGSGGGSGGGGGSSAPATEGVVGNVGFGFIAAPSLTSLSASQGPAGSQLTLTGSGFRTTAGDDTVLIGGVAATIVGSPTASSIVVQVPAGLMGEQLVTVTVGGQTSNALSFRRILGEFRANSYTTDSQVLASIAVDADGDFVIAWTSVNQDGDGAGVYAQRYNSVGTPQGSEFPVNSYTMDHQTAPSIAMDADGDFVIAWQSENQDDSLYGIYAQRFDSAGVAQGGEFPVNAYTTNDQSFPALAMDAGGDFVVVWTSFNQDGYSGDIYAQRYNSAGTPQGSEFLVNTYTLRRQDRPSIAMDADGDFVIAWYSDQDGSSYGIYAQRFDSAGTPDGPEFRVNSFPTGPQIDPSVAMDADGDFVIAWQSIQEGSGYGIYAQRFDSAGVAQGSEFPVNAYTTANQSSASIAIDANGNFAIAWISSLDQDGSSDGIYAQRFDAAGVAQGTEFPVNVYTTDGQSFPALAMDADGDFVAAWQSTQDDSINGIYAQRYDAAGEAQ